MNSKKSLTKFILLALEKSVDGYIQWQDWMANPGFYAKGYDRQLKKSNLSQALARVREYGWVELLDDQTITMRLTDKGREQAVLARLELEEEEWDGKWRVVLFDIPEKRKIVRNLLRRKLKSWGFKPWQKSVWVSKKDCTKVFRKFVGRVGIRDWVKLMEANEIKL